MRTVKRQTRVLNKGKYRRLQAVAQGYAAEKNDWLERLSATGYRDRLKQHRKIRDEFVAQGYQSRHGLPARLWKLALIEACETLDKYYQSHFEALRKRIAGLDWTESQKHYANWLLTDYSRLFSLLADEIPEFNSKNQKGVLEVKQQRAVIGYLRKRLTRLLKTRPRVKKDRSFALDAGCYAVYERDGKQFLAVMTLERGKRVVLPLLGKTAIAGNIRLVYQSGKWAVHLSFDLQQQPIPANADKLIALDFGYSEVATDQHGNTYGNGLGAILTAAADFRTEKGRKRNQLRALAKKYKAQGKHPKARRILKNNLGSQKWNAQQNKTKIRLDNEINQAFNQVKAQQVITEDLTQVFKRKPLPPKVNNRLSGWVKGSLKKRIEFKALVKGFDHQTVNAAYSSQTCPKCDFVQSDNRKGDRFLCGHCRFEGKADQVAGMNLERRVDDREIRRYTPYRQVKAILQARFQRSMEVRKHDCDEQDTRYGTGNAQQPVVSGKAQQPLNPSVNP